MSIYNDCRRLQERKNIEIRCAHSSFGGYWVRSVALHQYSPSLPRRVLST